jgi:hypothetical protein
MKWKRLFERKEESMPSKICCSAHAISDQNQLEKPGVKSSWQLGNGMYRPLPQLRSQKRVLNLVEKSQITGKHSTMELIKINLFRKNRFGHTIHKHLQRASLWQKLIQYYDCAYNAATVMIFKEMHERMILL